LRELCRAFFDASVRTRGQRYFEQGRVRLDSVEIEAVSAAVEGSSSRRYRTVLELDAASGDPVFLHMVCDCPHYEGGNLCKHLWAVVLALDERGWRRDLPRGTDVVVLHAEDQPFDAEGDSENTVGDTFGFDEDQEDPQEYLPSHRSATPTRALAGAHDGRWRALLNAAWRRQVAAEADPRAFPGAPEREAWFVVNPEASREHGGLVIEFHHRARRKDGTLGRVKREGVGWQSIARFGDAEDRRLIELLLGNEPVGAWGYDSGRYGDPGHSSGQRVAPVMVETLVPDLCATGRLVWHQGGDTEVSSFLPLAWDGGAPWALRVRCEAQAGKGGWQLSGELRRAGDTASPTAVRLVADDGLVIVGDRIARLAHPEHAGWVAAFASRAAFHVPAAERDAFLTHWWTMPARPQAELPDALALEEVQGEPLGCVELRSAGRSRLHGSRDVLLEVTFAYGAQRIEPETVTAALVDLDARRVVRRDRERERALLERLSELGARWSRGYYGSPPELRIATKRAGTLERTLGEEGWQVTVDGRRLRAPGVVSLSVSSGIDWFDLEGGVDFDGMSVALPALLGALRAGERSVDLPDGSRGALPEAWLERHGSIVRLGAADGEHLRFSRGQAMLLDALLAEQEAGAARVDAPFRRWRERLGGAGAVEPCDPPRLFRGTLREYQRDGLGWLRFLDEIEAGGCLADDMGLGKTVQVLALLEWWRTRRKRPERAQRPSLVVVPRSLVWNWLDEAARFAPGLRLLDYTGSGRAALRERFDEHDLVVTTYGTLRRDVAALKDRRFHYVILDEAQAIKNARSQVFKACRLLAAERRLAVTGTPVENHLGELWALFEFLNPGLLGAATAFESIARSAARSDPEVARQLGQGLKPFILRRTKEQVLDDLPPKTEQTLVCELAPKQRRHYEELRTYYRTLLDERIAVVGLGRAKIHVLEALLRLRQAACHPGLVDPARAGEPSAKIDALVESLRDVVDEGHKALVFSQFTRFLALVRTALEGAGITYEYLDGRTRDRAAKVERFQGDPDCPLFLVSLKAGGQGLNLTAADYVFILDPWWNPAVEAQAVDRTHRIGQTRPVFAYRLIAKDTVEEKIVKLQERKRALAEAVITQDDSVMRRLTVDDLELLLG
jgi:superfamily II DNA or RNA helicase